MTVTRSCIAGALALGALAGSAGFAVAGGEVIYGGVRQTGAAVPVPAPVPIPEVATGWYLRADAAYSQGDVKKYSSTDPNYSLFRGDSYLDNFPRYGFGVGYYFNKWLRADLTIDQRNDARSRGGVSRDYTIPNTAGGGTSNVIQMRDTYSDSFISSNSTALFNLYADLPVSRSFTPYVGAGLGFVRHQLKGRGYSKSTVCVDRNDCDPTRPGDDVGSSVNSYTRGAAGGVDYALAMSLMAGVSFKVWDNTNIDLGYRWLHLQGNSWAPRSVTGNADTLKLPDQNIHELRAGVRFDIN